MKKDIQDLDKYLASRPGVPPPAELPSPETVSPEQVAGMYESGEIDLVCILGPTASGKTRYAVEFCRALSGMTPPRRAEILSADSRQVYRGMDIGTGKDLDEYGEVPYHLIDIAPAGYRYNLYEYQRDFEKAYSDVRERGCIPVLCGGSGLYVEAATCGYTLPDVQPDPVLRLHLENEDEEVLRQHLLSLRPDAEEGTLQSKRRVIRAIEVALWERDHPTTRSSFLPKNTFYIGTLVSRQERVRRIDARLDERLRGGLIEEVRGLLESGIPAQDLVYYGLEYKFVTQHVQGILSYDEMRTLLANAIHQFAKRQMTWFRGMEKKGIRIHWVEP